MCTTGLIIIENNETEIANTNYWDTEHAQAGFVFLSINAGAFRLLIPDTKKQEIKEMMTAKEIIVSRGPWYAGKKPDAIEILYEDFTDTPFSIQMGTEQLDRLPADWDRDRKGQAPRWKFSVWTSEGKVLELPCRYRRAEAIPCLKPW